MTVEELIAELEYLNPEAEIRVAIQPNYPLEYTLAQVVEAVISTESLVEWADGWHPTPDNNDMPVVYLGVGGQIGYLPGQGAEELGW